MITEKTPVTLGLVGGSAVVLVGAILWLTTVFAQVRHNGSEISELKDDVKTYLNTVQTIDRRLSRIEGKLDIQPKKGE